MKGYQQVMISGNLGSDPDIREFNDGGKVANFSVAVNESWKDREGQKHERVEWFRCVARGGLAEVAGRYLEKGDGVLCSGRLRTRKWQDKEGIDRYATELIVRELVMLGGASRRESGEQQAAESPEDRVRRLAGGQGNSTGGEGQYDDDDLPF